MEGDDQARRRDEVEMAASNLTAMSDGVRAHRAGHPRDANPWDKFRPEQENWDLGWMMADQRTLKRE